VAAGTKENCDSGRHQNKEGTGGLSISKAVFAGKKERHGDQVNKYDLAKRRGREGTVATRDRWNDRQTAANKKATKGNLEPKRKPRDIG